MFLNSSQVNLTYISLTSFLWVIDKQNSPRCDAAKRGVLPGAILFAFNMEFIENEIEMKNLTSISLEYKWTHPNDMDGKVHSSQVG